MKKMRVRKSHNPDNLVPLRVMKNLGTVFTKLLLTLFSSILSGGAVPTAFKRANVMPLYKGKGSKLMSNNYRPISLLNDYCKLFEMFLSERIKARVRDKLCDKQHAYRENRSCNTALRVFTNFIYDEIDKPRTKVGAIFIDFTKAFDSISHSKLINKLNNEFELEPYLVRILQDNMSGRVFSINNLGNRLYTMERGICQGSANGPLTFSLYINDIRKIITAAYLLYADDIVIYASGDNFKDIKDTLVADLERIQQWCSDNSMSIN
ncbi:unnamed protein product [Orchesella dallaii]|uniref:Reverse transcriptase domain-containing protein n=1 Tax=Orchesella dallaii TaxID=48710 RepID=A0ABP1R8U9_9HEXA